ncbi:SH3 domain-containing protein [Ancylobacter mangrovi]|uniref:SH3 domain-containing protein n=1 Tax=Ancylobacter mangrovi TaxID=2972472 RepID=UPI0021630256|nr:SH3 domain-containing protein [Ancylobacter mangrovi]MCS0504552.1 SH3 domain-containing protein [Ancylobacter mangrovi]
MLLPGFLSPRSMLLALGLLLAGTAAAAARPAVATADLNVRSGPGTRYRVVGVLQAGQQVDAGSCSGGWCRVGGGYASSSYLSFGGGGTRVIVNPDYYDGYDDGYVGFGFGPAVGLGWGWGGGYWGGGPWGNYWGPPRYYGRNYWGPNGRPGYRPPPNFRPRYGYRGYPSRGWNRPPHMGPGPSRGWGRGPGYGPRPSGYRPGPGYVPRGGPGYGRPGGGGRPMVRPPGFHR